MNAGRWAPSDGAALTLALLALVYTVLDQPITVVSVWAWAGGALIASLIVRVVDGIRRRRRVREVEAAAERDRRRRLDLPGW